MAIFDQFSNKYISDYTINPTDFASQYANIIPYNPYIKEGIPASVDPTKIINDPAYQENLRKQADFFFQPYERKKYREATIPRLINTKRSLSNLYSNLNARGMQDSSVGTLLPRITKASGQADINQVTDTINDTVSLQRQAEMTKRAYEEIGKLKQVLSLLPEQFILPNNTNINVGTNNATTSPTNAKMIAQGNQAITQNLPNQNTATAPILDVNSILQSMAQNIQDPLIKYSLLNSGSPTNPIASNIKPTK